MGSVTLKSGDSGSSPSVPILRYGRASRGKFQWTDMAARYHIAIVGSGPGGFSAAGRAAEYDIGLKEQDADHQPTHILLEEFEAPAKTDLPLPERQACHG
ncbi:MAG: hypothetical protein U5O39_20870 [Gammaproteobacteria bacterium]|nr:hypothetical protein [Gammaproteobacteria bacterium]